MNQHIRALSYQTFFLTFIALSAFAANSVLCRYALAMIKIDPASFTVIRLVSGIIVLFAIISLQKGKRSIKQKGSWFASLMLFLYAACFSFAYIQLDTGMGALILFGSVQISMILAAVKSGYRLHLTEWLGLIIAFTGFIYLVLPGASSPSIDAFILMLVSGVSWAFYSLKGLNSQNALLDTSYNFLKTLPFIAILALLFYSQAHYSYQGVLLAVCSGAITSAVGYTIWYMALKGLTSAQAAVVQLAVPALATFGGVVFLSEKLSIQFIIASLLILGGILLVILGRYYFIASKAHS